LTCEDKSVEHAQMRSSFSQFRPVVSVLAWSAFAILPSCGGNSSSSSADKGTPSSDGKGTPSVDEKSLFVVGAEAVDAPECVAKGDMSAKLLSQGVFDLAFTTSYSAFLLVGNQLLKAGSATETERVSLSSAEVTLTAADGRVVSEYSTVGTGFIDAASSSAAYGTMSVSVIPPGLGLTASAEGSELLVAKIRVLGEALNGTKLTSSELDLPIRMCTGCLVQYPPSAADPTQPTGSGYQCTIGGTTTQDAAPAPCVFGQDAPFSCVVCAAAVALCRDPTLNPSISQ
jgi:hypothetical protein